MSISQPYRLANAIQHYEWGSRGKNAYIPRLLDIDITKDIPYAELWIGSHPRLPSTVLVAGEIVSLLDLINRHPEEMLGSQSLQRFGSRLPFMLKVLSAERSLSIQAHPNKQQATILHKNNPIHYPDDNYKPEIAIAIDHLHALIGFKPWDELVQTLYDIPQLGLYAGQGLAQALIDLHSFDDLSKKITLKAFFQGMMERSIQEDGFLGECLEQIHEKILKTKQPSAHAILFCKLREQYPKPDIGLLSMFLYNLLELQPGEAIFLDAGMPHSYIEGNLIECMANSDNVVRAGLTPKFKDVRLLVDILTYECKRPEIMRVDPENITHRYPLNIPDFMVLRHAPRAMQSAVCTTHGMPQILLCLEGSGQLSLGEKNLPFQRGSSLFIPACLPSFKLTAQADSLLFQAGVP